MNERTDLDRRLEAWMSAEAPRSTPDDLLSAVFATTGASRPWPTWRALLSVPPMRSRARDLVGSTPWRFARILVAVALLAGMLLVGALAGTGAQRILDRRAADLPTETTIDERQPSSVDQLGPMPRFTVDLAAVPTVTWRREGVGDTQVFTARRAGLDDLVANLIVTRPTTAFEPAGPVPAPKDLVQWLSAHPALSVEAIGPASLDGVPAVVVEARTATEYLKSLRSFQLLPGFLIDRGWRYRILALDMQGAGWFVAICEAWRNWGTAAAACEGLLASLRFVDAVPPRPAGGDVFAPGEPAPPLTGSRLVLDDRGQPGGGGSFDLDDHRGRPAVVLSARSIWPGRPEGDPAIDVKAAVANLATMRLAVGEDATFVVIAWPHYVGFMLDRWLESWGDVLKTAADTAGPAVQDLVVVDGGSIPSQPWAQGWTALNSPYAPRGGIWSTSLVILDREGRVSHTFLEPLPPIDELARLIQEIR